MQFPGYGTAIDKNNVVNFVLRASAILPMAPGWRAQGTTTSSAVIANVPHYAVDWYFVGAESGDTIKFMSQSLSITRRAIRTTATNPGNDPGWLKIGTTTGSGQGQPIPFTLIDTNPNPDNSHCQWRQSQRRAPSLRA